MSDSTQTAPAWAIKYRQLDDEQNKANLDRLRAAIDEVAQNDPRRDLSELSAQEAQLRTMLEEQPDSSQEPEQRSAFMRCVELQHRIHWIVHVELVRRDLVPDHELNDEQYQATSSFVRSELSSHIAV